MRFLNTDPTYRSASESEVTIVTVYRMAYDINSITIFVNYTFRNILHWVQSAFVSRNRSGKAKVVICSV